MNVRAVAAEMLRLAGSSAQLDMYEDIESFYEAHLPKSARKSARKMDALRAATAEHYKGIDPGIVKWGHDAHAEGVRAFGIDRDPKTHPSMKIDAHNTAYQSHMLAAQQLSQAGHQNTASLHQRAANYHMIRKQFHASKIGPSYYSPGFSDGGSTKSAAAVTAGMTEAIVEMQMLSGLVRGAGPVVSYGGLGAGFIEQEMRLPTLKGRGKPKARKFIRVAGLHKMVKGKKTETKAQTAAPQCPADLQDMSDSVFAYTKQHENSGRLHHLRAGEKHGYAAQECNSRGFRTLGEKHQKQANWHLERFASNEDPKS